MLVAVGEKPSPTTEVQLWLDNRLLITGDFQVCTQFIEDHCPPAQRGPQDASMSDEGLAAFETRAQGQDITAVAVVLPEH
jgi:hypothetical protein